MEKQNVELQNRKYKGVIKNGYIYYTYDKKVKMKDGTYKNYKNTIKRKRGLKLKKRGKDKQKRSKGSGRPIKLKNKINNLVKDLDDEKQKEIHDYILSIMECNNEKNVDNIDNHCEKNDMSDGKDEKENNT